MSKEEVVKSIPRGNWFITLRDQKNGKETLINVSQIVSVYFDQEKNPRNQSTQTLALEGIKHWLIIATSIGTYKCQMDYDGWRFCASCFKENNFMPLFDKLISCNIIEFMSN